MKSIIGGLKKISYICRVNPTEGCQNGEALATFPTLDKPIGDYQTEELYAFLEERGVSIPKPSKQYKVLIVNFNEKDFGVTLNSRLALTYPERIIDGATILLKLFGVRRCIMVFPRSKYKEANVLVDKAAGRNYIKFETTSDVYPLYNPYVLISYLYNTEISPSKKTSDTSYGIVTPEDCVNVYNALALGIKCGKYFSVEGEESKLVFTEKGRKIGEFLPDGLFGYVNGAVKYRPMSDETVDDIDGITLLSKPLAVAKEFECDGCGVCNTVCPMKIAPSELIKKSDKGVFDILSTLCIECGCCSFVCPSGIDVPKKIKSPASFETAESVEIPEIIEDEKPTKAKKEKKVKKTVAEKETVQEEKSEQPEKTVETEAKQPASDESPSKTRTSDASIFDIEKEFDLIQSMEENGDER